MIWLSPNEGHLRQTNVTIRLLRIKLCRVYPDIRFEMSIMGFCAFSEDPRGILCIFGSSMWDFVPFWKILVGFCAYLEVPHRIL
jgi:hypothetical protein